MKRLWRGGWLLLAVLILAGFWRLRLDVEVLNLLPPDQPAVQGLKLYQQHFANARELIITLRTSGADTTERLAAELAARLERETNLVAGVVWQPPWVAAPEQLAEILACRWLNQPPASFAALTNRLAGGRLEAELESTREALATSLSPIEIARRAYDPFNLTSLPTLEREGGFSLEQGQRAFSAAGGAYRLVFVQARPELTSYVACAAWLKAVQAAVEELRAGRKEWTGAAIHYTGRPVFVTEMAASMQSDLSGSVVGTAAIIALLFWLAHRRWLPMLWLLALLAGILAATLALGGLLLGSISVLSLGFAAVLLGLAVDYAVVHYQEALAHPQSSVPEIRRAIAPSILWAAVTTISAFLVLNLSGLPGLAQLGTLVGIGVALAAWAMVMLYLPPLFPARRRPAADQPPQAWWTFFIPPRAAPAMRLAPKASAWRQPAWWLTGVIVLGAGATLCWRRPGLDSTGNALRPQRGEAEATLQEMTAEMGIPKDALWVIVSGAQEKEVSDRLDQAETLLKSACTNRIVGQFLLPTALWPRPQCQESNRAAAAWLGAQGPRLRESAIRAGFTAEAMTFTDAMLSTWAHHGASAEVLWPGNPVSQWLMKRFTARADGQCLAMGLVYPAANRVAVSSLADLSARLAEHGVRLSGWELLGRTTLQRVQERLWWVLAPMIALVLISLWLAFGRAAEILLGVAVLLLSGLFLLATMAVAGWSWNLLNLMALPLLLGTGVDYSLFMQLALRRYGGDARLARQSIGRALLLCGGTATAGFGSLAWSSYPGMASLGLVCAVGIAANMLIAVYLLPAWWGAVCGRDASVHPAGSVRVNAPTTPSSFYRAGLWRVGLVVVRALPEWLLRGVCIAGAMLHWHWRPTRRAAVVRNLLPACQGDKAAALRTARRLYGNFARKLADLWRVESGQPRLNWLTVPSELAIIQSARARGRGVLFITLHLGNWEHGGLLLAELGLKLTVLTLPEPDPQLTALRTESRARWGIETLVLGQDGFAFIEVIKRLDAGGTLAIAIDRPPQRNQARVQLFGRPFDAPLVAAELARASGCALVGVTITRHPHGFAVKVLPEFAYARQTLGNRDARRELTQNILRAFEPVIQQHLDQWYQFVPIWPEEV